MIGSIDIFVHKNDKIEIELCEGDLLGKEIHYWLSLHFPDISVCFHLDGERTKDKLLKKLEEACKNPPEVK